MSVVFNNVSKHESPTKKVLRFGRQTEEEVLEDFVSWRQYICDYKSQLVETLFKQYEEQFSKGYIIDRVNTLFQEDNFYFFKQSDEKEQMKLEWEEIKRLINDNINAPQVYIQQGILEPLRLVLDERVELVQSLEDLMKQSLNEIELAQARFYQQTRSKNN